MILRFLIDEDTPLMLAQELSRAGHIAAHSRQVGLLGHSDADVLALAVAERRILVTRDLGFGDTRSHPAGSHAGIIILRVPTNYVARQIVDLFMIFLSDVDQSQLDGALVILRPTGYRIRREASE